MSACLSRRINLQTYSTDMGMKMVDSRESGVASKVTEIAITVEDLPCKTRSGFVIMG